METAERFTLRKMTPDDLTLADSLRAAAGWNQTPADIARLLSWEPDCCFMATCGGQPVGTATATCYGTRLAWIGMVLVAEQFRRRGIGRALVHRCLEELDAQGVGAVRLDATPAGQPVYERLGFLPEWSLARWERAGANAPPISSDHRIRDLTAADWQRLAKLDRRAFGVDRLRVLRPLAEDRHVARVITAYGCRPTAFGMLRAGSKADYLGPVVAETPADGRALATDLIGSSHQDQVFWDIPDRNPQAIAVAAELDFHRLRPLVRMTRGAHCPSADALLQWAIADPALG